MKIRTADLRDSGQRAAIEGFVDSNPDAQLFHQPAWAAAVERGCGAGAHYLVAEGEGGIKGLLPLSEVRSRLFGNSMVSVGFGVGGGILADEAQVADALAAEAWRIALRHGCDSVELRGGVLPDGWQRQEGIYADFTAPLGKDDQANLLSIKKRQRAEVRRAEGFGLEFRSGRTDADLDAHYRAYSASVRNHGTPIFPRSLFEAMGDEFGEDSVVVTAWKDGRPLSAIFSFYFKGTVYPFWGGGTAEAREWRANEWLLYRLMCHASRRGCARIDYGRSKLGTGPYAFKKNWGLEPRPLVYAVRTADGARPREMNPLSPKYRLQTALWRKLPLAVANRVGPHIARGLG
jgi:FemAB-related protein (PEP-CTERM system-associated)